MRVFGYGIESGSFSVLRSLDSPASVLDALFAVDSRLAGTWEAINCELLYGFEKTGQPRKRKDLTWSDYGGLLAGGEHACSVISARFPDWFEFLTLGGEAAGLWVMHVLTTLDCISEEKSRPTFADYDLTTVPFTPIGPRVGFDEPFFFESEAIKRVPAFKDRKIWRRWFIGEDLHQFLSDSGLTGYEPRLMFDSAKHANGFDENGDPFPVKD